MWVDVSNGSLLAAGTQGTENHSLNACIYFHCGLLVFKDYYEGNRAVTAVESFFLSFLEKPWTRYHQKDMSSTDSNLSLDASSETN